VEEPMQEAAGGANVDRRLVAPPPLEMEQAAEREPIQGGRLLVEDIGPTVLARQGLAGDLDPQRFAHGSRRLKAVLGTPVLSVSLPLRNGYRSESRRLCNEGERSPSIHKIEDRSQKPTA